MTATPFIGTLANSAVLVSLSISVWSARRFDRDASAEVTKSNDADFAAARVNKRLISGEALDRVTKAANKARAEHERLTLPWLHRGTALLPCAAFPEYQAAMSPLRSEFESAVSAFVATYPALRDAAAKELGKLFKADDYPLESDVLRRFGFSIDFLPVPASGDFRVDIEAGALDDMRREVEAATQRAASEAVADVFRRVNDVTARMAERLRDYQPGTDGKRAQNVFRDSLVGNVRELAQTLPKLNLFADPVIDQLAAQLQQLAQNDAETLRDSDALREVTAREAARIADMVSAYL